jgi:hypothetical protein
MQHMKPTNRLVLGALAAGYALAQVLHIHLELGLAAKFWT